MPAHLLTATGLIFYGVGSLKL